MAVGPVHRFIVAWHGTCAVLRRRDYRKSLRGLECVDYPGLPEKSGNTRSNFCINKFLTCTFNGMFGI